MSRYGRFRHKSLFKPKGGMNRSYTAIATPILDSFSQDLTKRAIHGSLPLSVVIISRAGSHCTRPLLPPPECLHLH